MSSSTRWSRADRAASATLLAATLALAVPPPAVALMQAAALTPTASSLPEHVLRHLDEARPLGAGRLTWFGLHIYDAQLFVARGFDPSRPEAQPLALELTYARRLSGHAIAERSYDEIARLALVGVTVWCVVEARTSLGTFRCLRLPRSETADPDHIILKLGSGYNIGVRHDTVLSLEKQGFHEAVYKIPEKDFPKDEGKPRVKLLGTGGTIAWRLDYRTGAVIPAFSPGELYGSVPELADICNLDTEKIFGIFSENMGPEQYVVLARKIGEAIEEGYDGIVIGHGTDTMHHTAAALSFMVQRPPVPIIMVGSQRSSDRPSSDGPENLINAVSTAARGDIAEVMVCMFGPTSDRYNLLHRGTRVRKMHDPTRDTTDGRLIFSACAENVIAIQVQMPHGWKQGSALKAHVHWSPTNTNTGNVLWRLKYKVANINEAFPADWTTLDVLDAGDGTADLHQIAAFGSISMTGKTFSCMLLMLLSRVGNDGTDTYTCTAKLNEFDIHYEIERFGTDDEYAD